MLRQFIFWTIFLFSVSAFAGQTIKVGGPGGNQTASIECPAGEVAIGLHYKGEGYINSVQIRCGKKDATGTKMVFTRDTNWAGAAGGNRSSFDDCKHTGNPEDLAVSKLYVKAATYIDLIGRQVGTGGGPGYLCLRVTNPSGGGQGAGSNIGGSGGTSFELTCPGGEYLYKLTVKYGWWLDSLQGFCRRP